MKKRIGFVSNSSSSSFIVIGSGSYEKVRPYWHDYRELNVNYNFGYHEFGGEQRKYFSIEDKICFAAIQIEYVKQEDKDKGLKFQELIENVIKRNTKIETIHWLLQPYNEEHDWLGLRCYIDHQSAAYEGNNLEIFDNEEILENFLFNSRSFIQGDNDNH